MCSSDLAAARQYQYEQEKPELTDEDIKHLAPESSSLLTLHADNRTAEEKQKDVLKYRGSDGQVFYTSITPPETTHEVSMSVGKDNRLWLKIGDKWKRVALDTEV